MFVQSFFFSFFSLDYMNSCYNPLTKIFRQTLYIWTTKARENDTTSTTEFYLSSISKSDPLDNVGLVLHLSTILILDLVGSNELIAQRFVTPGKRNSEPIR